MELLPFADHPTMSVAEFDRGVHRAHCDGCRVIPSGVAGIVFVTSGNRPGIAYRVTRTSCSCPAGKVGRPCKHIALAVFMKDMMGGFGAPAPAPANVTFIHTRNVPRPAA